MTTSGALPLAGLNVLEIGGGAAAAYCARLLVDAGASVSVTALSDSQLLKGIVRSDDPLETAYAEYLLAGKRLISPAADEASAQRQIESLAQSADLVIVGEGSSLDSRRITPRIATIDLSWFGNQGGRYHDWQGSDLVIQALSGMPQMAGHSDGSPTFFGDRQSSLFGGITAYIAACAAVLAPAGAPRRYELSVFEAFLVLSEMHIHFHEKDGIPMRRCGLNRFSPNSPVGVYPCKGGWVGITITTPDQWRSMCKALELRELAADPGLVTRELRFARADEVEIALKRALAARTADEWGAIGRQFKVPIVVVPDAAGILSHPIFADRESLASVTVAGRSVKLPRTPFALTRTPVRHDLDGENPPTAQADPAASTTQAQSDIPPDAPPLAGLTVVDFAMGWAGPLASRLLGDLGADILKIEAARYPDWWRGVNWTPQYIQDKGYEDAKTFCAMNRGKRGISIDLTTPEGREIALSLIAKADVIVENQASGVMAKLGLGYEAVSAVRPDIVMLSMSAFGTGNAWSDTRAYGSTLEQGSGLPSFMGFPQDAPTMAHLAYGDPVGGLFGCAAALTALISRRKTGEGQYVNLSMVETMMQFTTPSLLAHQLDAARPARRGNRHAALVPHGIYPAAGVDQWVAISVDSGDAFAALARLIGQSEWAQDPALQSPSSRRAIEDALDAQISAWTRQHDRETAAQQLQAVGIAAAPIAHADRLTAESHLEQTGYFIDLLRKFSGPQRQGGLAIIQDGRRLGARSPAPLLGEHTWEVLSSRLDMSRAQYDALVDQGVISFAPAPSRNNVAAPSQPET